MSNLNKGDTAHNTAESYFTQNLELAMKRLRELTDEAEQLPFDECTDRVRDKGYGAVTEDVDGNYIVLNHGLTGKGVRTFYAEQRLLEELRCLDDDDGNDTEGGVAVADTDSEDEHETDVSPTKLLFQASALLEIMAKANYNGDYGTEEIGSDAVQDAAFAIKRLVDDAVDAIEELVRTQSCDARAA